MLTREQLDHLCMLTALELPDAEKELLLPQLWAILDFVGQLEAYTVEDASDDTQSLGDSTSALSVDEQRGSALLANIRHEIINRMPHLKTGLTKN